MTVNALVFLSRSLKTLTSMLSGCGDLRKSILFKCSSTYFHLPLGKKNQNYKLPLIFHLKWWLDFVSPKSQVNSVRG